MIKFKQTLTNEIIDYGIKFLSIMSIPLNVIAFFALKNVNCLIIRFSPVLLSLVAVGLFGYRKKVSLFRKLEIFSLILFLTGIYTLLLGLLDMASLWFILTIIFALFSEKRNLAFVVFIAALILSTTTGLLMIFKNPYIPIDYGFDKCQFACVSIRIINFLIIGFLIFKILKMFFSTIDLYINEIMTKNIVLEKLKISENNEAEQRFKNQILKNDIEKQDLELTYKHKELTTAFSKIIQFNNLLDELKNDIQNKDFKKTLLDIKSYQSKNYSLDNMMIVFNELYPQFSIKLKETFPQLTETDIKVCVLIVSHLKSMEIAQILSITEASVGTYRNRIRKKLNIEHNTDIAQYLLTKFNTH